MSIETNQGECRPLSRRQFFSRAGLSALAGTYLTGCGSTAPDADAPLPPMPAASDEWNHVREQFALSPDVIHLSALYVAAHPKPVRDAIEEYRRKLDAEPVDYLNGQNRRRQQQAREAAARYLSVDAREIYCARGKVRLFS